MDQALVIWRLALQTAADHPFDPHAAHQMFDGAAVARQAICKANLPRGGGAFTLPSQNMPDIPCTIELAVGIPSRVDLEAQDGVRLGPGRGLVGGQIGVTQDGAPVVVSALSAEFLCNSPAG